MTVLYVQVSTCAAAAGALAHSLELPIPMAETPAKKEARVVSSSVAGGGDALTAKDGRLSPEESTITPELITRVARYSAFDEGNTMDICLAVGPKVSREIRHS